MAGSVTPCLAGARVYARVYVGGLARHIARGLTAWRSRRKVALTLEQRPSAPPPSSARRRFLGSATASIVLGAAGVITLPWCRLTARSVWLWLHPNFGAREPGERHQVWVNYGDHWNPFAWVTIDWGDGTSEGAYANGYEISFFHRFRDAGDYPMRATIAGRSDVSVALIRRLKDL
jgi:hypothetical protein